VVLLGVAPWGVAEAALLVCGAAALLTCLAAVDRLLALVVPADLRGAVGAIAATYGAVLGVGLGGSVLAGIDGAQGLAWGLGALGAAGGVGALVLRSVGRQIGADVTAAVGSAVEALEAARELARGVRPPLLTCRGINFSYGPLQILFDVDFTVDDGEMVALLGTNGAGKSTLLRVISGLGLPSSGTVRVAGQDVTYAEPGDRVRQGVCQIPGGKAVFGPLSVVDNLRLYGYALGRDKKTVDRGIEESFATFPRLAERRNSPSSTMSGGEQQMLALSKALILRPRLLLIDELSLGLAPKVVGELLTLVRGINAKGTSVVLVEQSVNVALSLAQHAYFMEKGQVRFDGRTEDLLARPDILRSVFLSGVAAGTSS
jgi:ABC-type branched-subunit amino acid transport system ATPase component